MTMTSPLAPGPLSTSSCAAIHFLARQSVTSLSKTAFLRQRELLYAAKESTGLIPGGPTRLNPAAGN